MTNSERPYSVFREIRWREDPLYSLDPEHMTRVSLVRRPIHILYHAYMFQLSHQGTVRLRLSEADSILHDIQIAWSEIPGFRDYVANRAVSGSTPISLPKSEDYLDTFSRFTTLYAQIFRPLQEVLSTDAAGERNRRLGQGITLAGIAGVNPHSDEQESASPVGSNRPEKTIDPREVMALYDRVINLTKKQEVKQRAAMAELPERIRGDLGFDKDIEIYRLTLTKKYNAVYDCVDFTLTQRRGHENVIYLGGERYQAFNSFSWETNADFFEFVKMARLYVHNVSRWQDQNAFETPAKTKLFDGIYFFIEDRVQHMPVPRLDALTGEGLLSQIEAPLRVSFVRIALPYGDLCYDFQALGESPRKAGIISHTPAVSAVADLIHWTNAKYAPRSFVHREMNSIFQLEFQREDLAND